MKRGKRLTREQKITISNIAPKLRLENWLCIENTEAYIKLRHKETGTVITVNLHKED